MKQGMLSLGLNKAFILAWFVEDASLELQS